ncbi:nucleoside 2-deoxyribosyltransferase [Streptacidiphilus sp. 4-A2]|nr:nucleoside 2-deoxyribosyltransferase [Streptacidiphilus sp. 4-A2]
MAKVFLAGPYTQWMDWSAGRLLPDKAELLERLRTHLLSHGHAVFNAHHNESWGEGWLLPEICTPADHVAMQHADVVCAILGDPPSPGVLIELGWASALGVPIVLLSDQERPSRG